KFDTSTIPMRKWSEYEMDLLEEQKSQYAGSESASRFGGADAINRPGSAIGNIPKSMAGYAGSNYGTNSVYYDSGYGYNPMPNNMIPVANSGQGLPGGSFDYLASGRSSPMQMPIPGSGAFEMTTFSPARMSQANAPVVDPRMSQISGSPFSQPGGFVHDPRMSAAYPPVAASEHQYTGAETDTAGGNMFTLAPVSPLGLQMWPSGVSDDQLAARVAEIIATSDLMSITKKQVRQQIMANFGISADEEKSRREFINQCIASELEKQQSGA
ncbi:hypothetical protein EV183_005295, partial [Coemansia sp. RSA 2336]